MAEPRAYTRLTDAQIRTLAEDVQAGRVFGSWNLRSEDQHMVTSVFLITVLAPPETIDWMRDNKITHLYAPMSEAGERVVNGYPCFLSSIKFVDREDSVRLETALNELKSMLARFHAGGDEQAQEAEGG